MTETRTHVLTAQRSSAFRDMPQYFESVEEVKVVNDSRRQYSRFRVFGWTREGSGRVVHGGPQVVGPWAAMQNLPTVIALHAVNDARPVVEVKMGDLLVIAGTTYRTVAAPNANVKLVREDEEN